MARRHPDAAQKFLRFGTPDAFFKKSGEQEYAREMLGLTGHQIAEKILHACHKDDVPMKTEAALLVQTGKPLVLAEIEIPALKPGQVLVEIAYSGACGTQVMEWRGDKGEDKWVPHCLGHEGTGTVLETGSAVTKVKAGDKVVLSWIKGNGIEAGGAVYDWDGRKVNAGGVTTFQRHAVVSENRLTLLPPRSADGCRGAARLRRADRHGRGL